MSRFFSAFLVISIMLGFVTYPVCAEYWASKESSKYRYASCKWE